MKCAFSFLTLLTGLLFSCTSVNNKLAENIEGVWHAEYSVFGNEIYRSLVFQRDSIVTTKGTFTEEIAFHKKNDTRVFSSSQTSGSWYVKFGNIYVNYDISSPTGEENQDFFIRDLLKFIPFCSSDNIQGNQLTLVFNKNEIVTFRREKLDKEYIYRIREKVLSPDGKKEAIVAELESIYREESGEGCWLHCRAIGVRNVDSIAYRMIVKQKENWDDPKFNLKDFSNLHWDTQTEYVYFESEGWVTSPAIHRVNVETAKENYVSPGWIVGVAQQGKYADHLVCWKSAISKGRGRYLFVAIVNPVYAVQTAQWENVDENLSDEEIMEVINNQ